LGDVIRFLLEFCLIPFDEVNVLDSDAFAALKASGKLAFGQVPLLIDKGNGRALCQSASILEYLAEMLGKFAGDTIEEKIQAREWMFWDFDRLSPNIYRSRGIRLGLRSMPFDTVAMYYNEGNVALKVLDDHLKDRDWLVGKGPTIADIDVFGVIDYAAAGGFNLAQYANISAWIARFKALKGYAPAEAILPKESRAA
jgi:glutathione S-transferase